MISWKFQFDKHFWSIAHMIQRFLRVKMQYLCSKCEEPYHNIFRRDKMHQTGINNNDQTTDRTSESCYSLGQLYNFIAFARQLYNFITFITFVRQLYNFSLTNFNFMINDKRSAETNILFIFNKNEYVKWLIVTNIYSIIHIYGYTMYSYQSVYQSGEITSAVSETNVSRNDGGQVKGPLKPLNTIVSRCSMGFREALYWALMIPRHANFFLQLL